MDNLTELHHAAQQVETVEQADDILESVAALSEQALLLSSTAIKKAQGFPPAEFKPVKREEDWELPVSRAYN